MTEHPDTETPVALDPQLERAHRQQVRKWKFFKLILAGAGLFVTAVTVWQGYGAFKHRTHPLIVGIPPVESPDGSIEYSMPIYDHEKREIHVLKAKSSKSFNVDVKGYIDKKPIFENILFYKSKNGLFGNESFGMNIKIDLYEGTYDWSTPSIKNNFSPDDILSVYIPASSYVFDPYYRLRIYVADKTCVVQKNNQFGLYVFKSAPKMQNNLSVLLDGCGLERSPDSRLYTNNTDFSQNSIVIKCSGSLFSCSTNIKFEKNYSIFTFPKKLLQNWVLLTNEINNVIMENSSVQRNIYTYNVIK